MSTARVTGALEPRRSPAQIEAQPFPREPPAMAPGGAIVEPASAPVALDGTWAIDLERTDTMVPSGMLWELLSRTVAGVDHLEYIYVPSGGGRLEDLIAIPPDPPTGYSLPGPPGPPGMSTLPVVAGTAISAHRAVVQAADGRVYYASPTNPAHVALPLWLSLTAASAAGDALTVQAFGEVVEPSWAWSSGPIWVGAAGVLTQTFVDLGAGAWSRSIGAALDATTVFVSPSGPIVLAA
jgi:hypothetical protein